MKFETISSYFYCYKKIVTKISVKIKLDIGRWFAKTLWSWLEIEAIFKLLIWMCMHVSNMIVHTYTHWMVKHEPLMNTRGHEFIWIWIFDSLAQEVHNCIQIRRGKIGKLWLSPITSDNPSSVSSHVVVVKLYTNPLCNSYSLSWFASIIAWIVLLKSIEKDKCVTVSC